MACEKIHTFQGSIFPHSTYLFLIYILIYAFPIYLPHSFLIVFNSYLFILFTYLISYLYSHFFLIFSFIHSLIPLFLFSLTLLTHLLSDREHSLQKQVSFLHSITKKVRKTNTEGMSFTDWFLLQLYEAVHPSSLLYSGHCLSFLEFPQVFKGTARGKHE